MKLTQDKEDECLYYVEFASDKEFKEIRERALEWSGKKRLSNKQLAEFIIHTLRVFVEEQKKA